MDARENNWPSVAMLALGGIAALACASAIGAIAVLVVMAAGQPAPSRNSLDGEPALVAGTAQSRVVISRALLAPQPGECDVMAWTAGTTYCVRDSVAVHPRPPRDGPAIVVQADPAGR